MGFRAVAPVDDTYRGRRMWDLRRKAQTSSPGDSWPADTWKAVIDQTMIGAPFGNYLLVATLGVSAVAACAGYVQLQLNGIDQLNTPGNYARMDLNNLIAPRTYSLGYLHSGGNLQVAAYVFPAGQGGYVDSAATTVTVSYIGKQTA